MSYYGQHQKPRSRVKIIILLLFFAIPVLAIPMTIYVVEHAVDTIPEYFEDWLQGKIGTLFGGVFANLETRTSEWLENEYLRFQYYNPSDYENFYLAEGVSLYHYIETGQTIESTGTSISAYLVYFKTDNQEEIFTKLEKGPGITVSEDEKETVIELSNDLKQYAAKMTNTSNDLLPSDGSVTSKAVEWAVNIAENDAYGYCQEHRYGNPDYDCSSFVTAAYIAAGIPFRPSETTYTMKIDYAAQGFIIFDYVSVDQLKPGDVLLREEHTEMYIGDGHMVGAHCNEFRGVRSGVGGDQTDDHNWNTSKGEISVTPAYSPPISSFKWVLRYVR